MWTFDQSPWQAMWVVFKFRKQNTLLLKICIAITLINFIPLVLFFTLSIVHIYWLYSRIASCISIISHFLSLLFTLYSKILVQLSHRVVVSRKRNRNLLMLKSTEEMIVFFSFSLNFFFFLITSPQVSCSCNIWIFKLETWISYKDIYIYIYASLFSPGIMK